MRSFKFKRYMNTYGRLTRMEFFMGFLMTLAFAYGVVFVHDNFGEEFFVSLIGLALGIMWFAISLFSMIKRFHDLNYSGFWVLLMGIPYVNFIVFLY